MKESNQSARAITSIVNDSRKERRWCRHRQTHVDFKGGTCGTTKIKHRKKKRKKAWCVRARIPNGPLAIRRVGIHNIDVKHSNHLHLRSICAHIKNPPAKTQHHNIRPPACLEYVDVQEAKARRKGEASPAPLASPPLALHQRHEPLQGLPPPRRGRAVPPLGERGPAIPAAFSCGCRRVKQRGLGSVGCIGLFAA